MILDLLKAIDYEKNEVMLASPVDVFSGPLTDLGLPVTWLPLTVLATSGFLSTLLWWIRYLTRLAPQKIILAEGGFGDFPLPAVLAAFLVARGNVWMMELHPAPAPLMEPYKPHLGLGLGLYQRARAWLVRGILSVSQGVRDRLIQGYRYPSEKITVVHNGVDTHRFSAVLQQTRTVLRRNLQVPENAVIIVSSARLEPIKRLDRLIKAFAALSLVRNDLWLLLTGEGAQRDELQTLAESVTNRDNIRFLGHVEDVCPILQAGDIYVLPSEEEGFGVALVEAMACELVCVATRTVGPCEIIEDGQNGFLVDRSYEGVLDGLQQVLKLSHEERKSIGVSARQRVCERFRVEEAAAKGLAFLEIKAAAGTVSRSLCHPHPLFPDV